MYHLAPLGRVGQRRRLDTARYAIVALRLDPRCYRSFGNKQQVTGHVEALGKIEKPKTINFLSPVVKRVSKIPVLIYRPQK